MKKRIIWFFWVACFLFFIFLFLPYKHDDAYSYELTNLNILKLESGLRLHRIKRGFYPDSSGIGVIHFPVKEVENVFDGVQDNNLDYVDGWGEMFYYKFDEFNYYIISSGPDLLLGSTDDVVFMGDGKLLIEAVNMKSENEPGIEKRVRP